MGLKKAVGSQGSWFAKVDGVSLPCIHRYWLDGMSYHDPFETYLGDEARVREYADAIADAGQVILTDDKPTLNSEGALIKFERSRYVAIFEVGDVSYSPETGVRLRLTKRLDNLKP